MTRRLPPPARCLLPLLLALGVILAPNLLPAAPAVELILRGVEKPADDADEGNEKKPADDENLLSPAASFELRFEATMIAADGVGKEAADSPLAFTPDLPGTFRWTSQRGGVYTPAEPPPLGATYQAALRGGLKNLDGKPIVGSPDLKRAFHTPPLDIRVVITNATDDGDLPAQPKLQLLFNSAVSPTKIAPAFSFRGPDGNRIAARVTAVPENAPFLFNNTIPKRTWRELFLAAHAAPDAAKPTDDSRNRVEIAPASPLTVGKDWKLVAEAGLAGEDPGAKRTTSTR